MTIQLTFAMADSNVYVPAPCRGIVTGAKAVFQTNTVQVGDTLDIQRNGTSVCLITATETAGLVVETGVRDSTQADADLIFDPDSSTATNGVILVVPTGDPGASLVTIFFDPYASVTETPALA